MLGREYTKTMIQLATSGFGLVAALAWNSAIQELFKEIFGSAAGNIAGMFGYAALVTVIIVFVTTRLGKFAEQVEKQSGTKR